MTFTEHIQPLLDKRLPVALVATFFVADSSGKMGNCGAYADSRSLPGSPGTMDTTNNQLCGK